jgi:four helix bundle protein
MSNRIQSFKELEVYKKSYDLALQVFDLSKKFPVEEKYSLTDQIRRSSRSVCANIAEAWRKRIYPAAFVSKLSDSDAESAETEVWLDFAHSHGYIGVEIHNKLTDNCNHISAMLVKMMHHKDQWTIREKREERG